jgi:hypothetical protein
MVLLFFSTSSNAEQPKEDKVRDKNQKYATKLPRNPSMFEMYAAEQMTKAKIKNKDKNFSF